MECGTFALARADDHSSAEPLTITLRPPSLPGWLHRHLALRLEEKNHS
jgi:hypothetical protein